jgi:hypothetical protein
MFRIALVVAVATTLAACADSPAPFEPETTTAEQLKLKNPQSDAKGGIGNAQFSPAGTSCTFDGSGQLECDYQITGLGKEGYALVTLAGLVRTVWDCSAPAGEVLVSGVNGTRIAVSFDAFGDKSGNARGSMSATPFDLGSVIYCGVAQTGTRTIQIFGRTVIVPVFEQLQVTNVAFSLDSPAVPSEPEVSGNWALFAAVKTAKGAFLTYYGGSLSGGEVPVDGN